MPLSPPPNHTLTSWNVECGGYPDYYRSGAPNTQPIRNTITLINPDTICFSDVFGWSDEQLRNLQLWLMGSLGQSRWPTVLLVGGLVAAPIAAWLVSRIPARIMGFRRAPEEPEPDPMDGGSHAE